MATLAQAYCHVVVATQAQVETILPAIDAGVTASKTRRLSQLTPGQLASGAGESTSKMDTDLAELNAYDDSVHGVYEGSLYNIYALLLLLLKCVCLSCAYVCRHGVVLAALLVLLTSHARMHACTHCAALLGHTLCCIRFCSYPACILLSRTTHARLAILAGRFMGRVPSKEREGAKTIATALAQAQKNLKKAREPGREAILIITTDGLRVFEASITHPHGPTSVSLTRGS